ncbi:transcriptional regulator, partial [Bordetella pertussis]
MAHPGMNSATHLAAHEGSARRRQALGEFVRTARARITPQMA